MEYIIGSLFTFAVIYVFMRISAKHVPVTSSFMVLPYTQSQILSTTSMYSSMGDNFFLATKTQSFAYHNENSLRIFVMGSLAYWIKNNTVYAAPVDETGTISENIAQPLDMMAMSKVQLEEVKFIIDRLTEGTSNDTRNSRDT